MTSNEDSFKFKIISGDVTDHRPCSGEEVFSNDLTRKSFPVDYYFSPATALKQPESLDQACVCPLPPVLPPPPPPLSVNEQRQHHCVVSCVRKSLLGHFCRSVRKCLITPFHCGISGVDDIDARLEIESRSSIDVSDGEEAETVSPAADKWIEFDNPMYEAVLHCNRSSLLDAINNRGTGSCMHAEMMRKEETSIDR